MSAQTEYCDLIYQVKGQGALKDVQDRLAQINEEAAALKVGFENATISEEDLTAAHRSMAKEIARLKADMEGLLKIQAQATKATEDDIDALIRKARAQKEVSDANLKAQEQAAKASTKRHGLSEADDADLQSLIRKNRAQKELNDANLKAGDQTAKRATQDQAAEARITDAKDRELKRRADAEARDQQRRADVYNRWNNQEQRAFDKAQEAKIQAREREFQKAIDQLNREQAAEEKAAARTAARIAQTGGEHGQAARAMQERTRAFAYAVNDFFAVSGSITQRLNSVANNLPGLFYGMTPVLLNFGLALGAIAPIIAMIIEHWSDLKEMITGVADEWKNSVDGMKKRIGELESKKIRIGVETLELDQLTKKVKEIQDAIAAVEKLAGGRTAIEKESGAKAEEALMEGLDEKGRAISGEDVKRRIRPAVIEGILGANDRYQELQKEIASATKRMQEEQEKLDRGVNAQGLNLSPLERKGIEFELWRSKRSVGQLTTEQGAIRGRVEAEGKGDADVEIGKMIDQATKQGGFAQKEGSAKLQRYLRQAGLVFAAEMLEQSTPAFLEGIAKQLQKGTAQNKLRQLDQDLRVKQAHEGELAANAEMGALEKRQKVALDLIAKEDSFKQLAARELAATQNMGGTALEMYDELVERMKRLLKRQLAARGVLSSGAGVDAAAVQLAGPMPEAARTEREAAAKKTKADLAKAAQESGLIPDAAAALGRRTPVGKLGAEIQRQLMRAGQLGGQPLREDQAHARAQEVINQARQQNADKRMVAARDVARAPAMTPNQAAAARLKARAAKAREARQNADAEANKRQMERALVPAANPARPPVGPPEPNVIKVGAGAAQAGAAAVGLAANGVGLLNQAIDLNGRTLNVVGRVAKEQANQRRALAAMATTVQNMGLNA